MAAHLKRGLAYRQRGEPEAALRDLRRASELDPTRAAGLRVAGRRQRRPRPSRPGRRALRAEPALDDRQAEVFYKLAVARYRDGRSGAAIDPLRRALTLAPDFAEAQYLLGVSLRDAGRLDEALAALNAAARLSPGLLEAREARVDVLQARGEVARAVDELDALAALEPDRAERAVAVGAAYARAGRPTPRCSPLGRAAERFPAVERGLRGARRGLAARGRDRRHGGARQGAGRAGRAPRSLDDAGAETFTAARPRPRLAGDLEGAERRPAARRRTPAGAVRGVRPRWPTCSNAASAVAGGPRHAGASTRRSTSGTPAVAAAAPRIGALSMRIGDPHGASYWFEKAIAEGGPSTPLLPRLAEAESDRGATGRARELVEEGLALDPAHDGLRALAATLVRAADAGRARPATATWPAGAARRCRPARRPSRPISFASPWRVTPSSRAAAPGRCPQRASAART